MSKFHCIGCDTDYPQRPDGSIDEIRATPGGSAMRISLCFPCRRLVVPYAGSDRCDGRCDGGCDSAMAWYAECRDATGITLMDEWSCFDEDCVRAWIDHYHPDCGVDIHHGSPRWDFTTEKDAVA